MLDSQDEFAGEDQPSSVTVSAGQLRAVIERVERLEEEKKEVADQIKEVYAEAKGQRFRHQDDPQGDLAAQESPGRAVRGRGDARSLSERAWHAARLTV